MLAVIAGIPNNNLNNLSASTIWNGRLVVKSTALNLMNFDGNPMKQQR